MTHIGNLSTLRRKLEDGDFEDTRGYIVSCRWRQYIWKDLSLWGCDFSATPSSVLFRDQTTDLRSCGDAVRLATDYH